ncbi:MAG: polysaccharide biosynthesis/export family protein, partial [Edaphobacter sp.]
MMSQQNHLSMADLNQVSRRLSVVRLPLLTAVAVALCFCGPAANAQFSGPSVSASEQVNLPVTPTTDPAILYPASRDIILQQGDVLTVHIYGMTDYDPSARVSLDGTVQLPLIGRLQVQGLTLHQAESLIAQRLKSAGMYRDPQVTIQLTEAPNQVVTVTGEVH